MGFKGDCSLSRDQSDDMFVKGELNGVRLHRTVVDYTC